MNNNENTDWVDIYFLIKVDKLMKNLELNFQILDNILIIEQTK